MQRENKVPCLKRQSKKENGGVWSLKKNCYPDGNLYIDLLFLSPLLIFMTGYNT
jgi:hypothetical protein